MSNKIRLVGLFITAILLLSGVIAVSGVSSQNVGPVRSTQVVGTSSDSVKLKWKRVGSSDGCVIYQKAGEE